MLHKCICTEEVTGEYTTKFTQLKIYFYRPIKDNQNRVSLFEKDTVYWFMDLIPLELFRKNFKELT